MDKKNDQNRFWLERFYVSKKIPFHVFHVTGELIDVVGIEDTEEDPLKSDCRIFLKLYQKWLEKKKPILEIEDDGIIYLAFADEQENFYIGGPGLTEKSQKKIYEYRRKHNLSKKFNDIRYISLIDTANLLSMALGIINNQYIEEIELLEINNLAENRKEEFECNLFHYKYESVEQEKIHLSYESERSFLEGIRQGKVEQFEDISYREVNALQNIGKMADNEKKQIEYMTVATIALIGRAAIEGGLQPAEMYAVSDVFLQKLEKCTDALEMLQLNRDAQKMFMELVRERKEQKKEIYYIEECKNLISRNVHKHLTVEEIAKQIGINRTYLSSRFSELEGMTISQYNVQVRIKTAENMLKYSAMTISQIAEYLCFSSQSYFGKIFKMQNGITPVEFRRRYKVVDF